MQVHAGIAGNDAVEVPGKTLRHHQTFAPSFGTTHVIRKLRAATVMRPDETFRQPRHEIVGAISEIDARPRVVAERGGGGFGRHVDGIVVSGVLRYDGVAASERSAARCIADVAVRATAACEIETAIPIRWQSQHPADRVRLVEAGGGRIAGRRPITRPAGFDRALYLAMLGHGCRGRVHHGAFYQRLVRQRGEVGKTRQRSALGLRWLRPMSPDAFARNKAHTVPRRSRAGKIHDALPQSLWFGARSPMWLSARTCAAARR